MASKDRMEASVCEVDVLRSKLTTLTVLMPSMFSPGAFCILIATMPIGKSI